MKKSANELLEKMGALCDSGKPWYFFFGFYLMMLIVNITLLLTDEKKPSGWSVLMNVSGLIWSAANIAKTEKQQKENAETR